MARLILSPAVEALAAAQSGLLTRVQLASCGLDAAAVRRRLVSDWRLVLPGVVHLARTPLTEAQRPVAAVLMVGPSAAVTGAAAARWHGLTNAGTTTTIDLLVPSGRDRRAAFVSAVRTVRMPAPIHHDGVLALAPVVRCVADVCRRTRDERLARAVVIEAVQRRKTTTAHLRHELYAGPRRNSRLLRLAIESAETGAWSVPEHDLLGLLAASSHLPQAWPNPVLRRPDGRPLPTPDVWFDDVGVAVQVHSVTHHAAGPDWDRTVRDDSALAEAGILRISVTPHQVSTDPAGTLRRIEALHASRRATDRPAVTMTPRRRGR